MASATPSPSLDSLPPQAKPLARVAVVKPEHRLRAAALRATTPRASSEPPTTIFEERPTIPMWGLTGVNPARPPAEAKAEIAPPPVEASVPVPVPAAAEPAPEIPVIPALPTIKRRAAKVDAPAFGAGMLQARKVRTKDPLATQRIRAVDDGPMFGANVLRARQSAGKWVALALAVAAIAAVVVAAL